MVFVVEIHLILVNLITPSVHSKDSVGHSLE